MIRNFRLQVSRFRITLGGKTLQNRVNRADFASGNQK